MPIFNEHPLLQELAYHAWIKRGRPIGSPDIDWQTAKQQLKQWSDQQKDSSELKHEDASEKNNHLSREPLDDVPPARESSVASPSKLGPPPNADTPSKTISIKSKSARTQLDGASH